MKITWTFSNVQDTVAKMGVKRDKILAASRRGLIQGMRLFESKILVEQMSGPKTSPTTLAVRHGSGGLRSSWTIKPNDTSFGGITIVKLATRQTYAAVHQFGSRDWDGTFGPHPRVKRQVGAPKRHNIPKRLHIYEDFQSSGPAMLGRAVRDEVAMLGSL